MWLMVMTMMMMMISEQGYEEEAREGMFDNNDTLTRL